jgi:hypothetical protein
VGDGGLERGLERLLAASAPHRVPAAVPGDQAARCQTPTTFPSGSRSVATQIRHEAGPEH